MSKTIILVVGSDVMRKLSTKIIVFLLKEKMIEFEDVSTYQYGLEVLIENIKNTMMILLLGAVMGKGKETVIYLVIFCGLRQYCGGYHAETKMGCHIATGFSYLMFLLGITVFEDSTISWNRNLTLLYFICLVVIICVAPVENTNKPLTDCCKRQNRKKAIAGTILLGGVIFTLGFKLPVVSFAILATLIEVVLLMLIGRRKRERKTTDCQMDC